MSPFSIVMSLPVCEFYQRQILLMTLTCHAIEWLFLSVLYNGGDTSFPVSVLCTHTVLWWVWWQPTVGVQLICSRQSEQNSGLCSFLLQPTHKWLGKLSSVDCNANKLSDLKRDHASFLLLLFSTAVFNLKAEPTTWLERSPRLLIWSLENKQLSSPKFLRRYYY